MKKILLFFVMFLATGVLFAAAAQAETIAVKRIIEVPSAGKEQILDKVRAWSKLYGSSYHADLGSGVVVTNGEIGYPSPPIDRIQYTFAFKMENKIQDKKDTVTFEEVMLKSPTSYLPSDTGGGETTIKGEAEPVKAEKDVAAANSMLNYLADNLGDYLNGKTEVTCPLEKCPDCGVLYRTPAEMKEHMKGHGGHESVPKD